MTNRLRPLADVLRERADLAMSDALDLAHRGVVPVFVLRSLVAAPLNWTVQGTFPHPDEPGMEVIRTHPVSWRNLASSVRLPAFDFARIERLAQDEDYRTLTAADAKVRVERVTADLRAGLTLESRPEVWRVLYGTPPSTGLAVKLADLWVDPDELMRRMKRPRLLEDAARDAKRSLGDVLQAVAGGRIRVMCLVKPHLQTLAWAAHTESVVVVVSGFIGPTRPLPGHADFALVDELAEGSDVRALTAPNGSIKVRAFEAFNVVPFSLPDHTETFSVLCGITKSEPVTLTLADLWVMPDELTAAIAPPFEVGNDADRPPRHERDLKLCIGALAKLLAECAPRTHGFASKRKDLPYTASKIGEAVERECGLNSGTVAGWLGEAKKLLESNNADEA